MYLYTVYDSLAGQYHYPMTLQSDALAQRAFVGSVKESPMADHPADYTLMRIGEFDPETGVIQPTAPERVMTAWEAIHLLNQQNAPQLTAIEGGN